MPAPAKPKKRRFDAGPWVLLVLIALAYWLLWIFPNRNGPRPVIVEWDDAPATVPAR